MDTSKLDQAKSILLQPSTWKGFVLILGALGLQTNPENIVEIAQSVLAVYAAIAIIVDKN